MLTGDKFSYIDFVGPDETLDADVIDLCEQLEAEQWWVAVRMNSGFRYMCPCDNRHNRWLGTKPLAPQRIDFLFNKSCFTADRKAK